MHHIPPPPPGTFDPYGKHDEFDASVDHLGHKSRGKRKRKLIEDREWYLATFINDNGEYEIVSSGNLEPLEHLMNLVGQRILQERAKSLCMGGGYPPQRKGVSHAGGKTKAMWTNQSSTVTSSDASMSYPFHSGTRPYATTAPQPSFPRYGQMIPHNPIGRYHAARRPLGREPLSNGAIMRELTPTRAIRQYHVGDTAKWQMWFADAFRAVQQQTCRFIAKEWIKLIHPKKQSTHPYNGNFPRNCQKDPESTRPPYWPPDILHKEPDHISKDARTLLLVHLLMNTPQREIASNSSEGNSGCKQIFAGDMLDVLRKKEADLGARWGIIETVIFARQQLEFYEDGGCDADMKVPVPDYEEPSRPEPPGKKVRSSAKNKRSMVEQKKNDIGDGEDDSCVLPPTRPASPATPFESDDEDDKIALSASFRSDVTQLSSLSSQSTILPKVDENLIEHYCRSQVSPLQPMMFGAVTTDNGMNFDQHDTLHHQQPSIQQTWPGANAADSRLAMSFSNSVIASHPHSSTFDTSYGQEVFPDQYSAVTDGAMSSLPPYALAELNFNLGQAALAAQYGPMDLTVGHGQQFNLPENYSQEYPHHS